MQLHQWLKRIKTPRICPPAFHSSCKPVAIVTLLTLTGCQQMPTISSLASLNIFSDDSSETSGLHNNLAPSTNTSAINKPVEAVSKELASKELADNSPTDLWDRLREGLALDLDQSHPRLAAKTSIDLIELI